MKLFYSNEELNTAIANGVIRTQTHPVYSNLVILNYTQEVQFRKLWDELTIAARGMVIDTADFNRVVARPFTKFFNLSEVKASEIPTDMPYTVYEKLDGSLGILFNYKGEWIWCTRGSFTSDQAIWAKSFFEANYSYDSLNPEYTYLFELCYSDNVIVVRYDTDKIVSLGAVHTESGKEIAPLSEFPTPKVYDIKLENVSSYVQSNFEGFVVLFENGIRLKVKMEEYVTLHRTIFGLSSVRIWEALQEGSYTTLCSTIPEEFLPWVKMTAASILGDYHEGMASAYEDYRTLTVDGDRKATALNYQNGIIYSGGPLSARFAILDGKDPSDTMWKYVRPEHETIK